MAMKVGFQTIVWGQEFTDIESSFELLKRFHYQGVEIFQSPDKLPSASRLQALLQAHNLELVGMSGGTVEERVRYCGNLLRPKYLTVHSYAEEDAALARQANIPLALHPEVFAPVQRLRAAIEEFKEHPDLLFIPDTAHLTIAGDNPVEAIRALWSRLAAVHLKDWTPVYGHSIHRYAKGFAELGCGRLEPVLEGCVRELRKNEFAGWLIVEQDSATVSPERSVESCSQWLQDERRHVLPKVTVTAPPDPPGAPNAVKKPPGIEDAPFLRALQKIAVSSVDRFHEQLAPEFGRLIPSKLVSIWGYSPSNDMISLLAFHPEELSLSRDMQLDRRKAMSSVALETKEPVQFDLTRQFPGEPYGRADLQIVYPAVIEQTQARELWTIPVLNTHTPTQVRFLITFSPQDGIDLRPYKRWLALLAVDISRAAETALEERCSYGASCASLLEGKTQQSSVFLHELAREIKRVTHSQGCSIFLVNETGDGLECAGTTGIEWLVPEAERYYSRGSGLSGSVWVREEALTVAHGKSLERKPRSAEVVTDEKRDSLVFVPVRSSGDSPLYTKGSVAMLIRCRNKEHPNCYYSEDDVAVIDAMAQVALPHLLSLLADERRASALMRLTHELRTPLVAMRGAIDTMEDELEFHFRKRAEDIFREDYLQDARSWNNLMVRLLNNADLVSGRNIAMSLDASPILLLKDVLAAAIRQVDKLRDRRGLRGRIEHDSFETIPRLYVDRNLFQQVFFNLLSNAVKYAYDDADAFYVSISTTRVPDGFEIKLEDWGTGVERSAAERIFELGVRGPDRSGRNIAGQGIGLWVVRRVVTAHGGRIWVSHFDKPTEFTIFLPSALEYGPPARAKAATT